MGSETSKVAESLVKAQDRIAELEANERKLREALKVLAVDVWWCAKRSYNEWDEKDGDVMRHVPDSILANPIAAAAVREAAR